MRLTPLTVGEPAPWFHLPPGKKPRFGFNTVAGRHIVMAFFGSTTQAASREVLQRMQSLRAVFDDERVSFFGVTTDCDDVRLLRVQDSLPGVRYFHDFDGQVSALYGARLDDDSHRPVTYLLDPTLRVLERLDWTGDPGAHVAHLKALLDGLPVTGSAHAAAPQAPVLVVPRVFPPDLCQALVSYYNAHGGSDSGFMRDINGQTTTIVDHGFKRRSDRMVEDQDLQHACAIALRTRLMPEVYKAFQFKATYIERSLISCYDAKDGRHFQAHRDNTTLATSHRRFAVSLFLNSDEYQGGQLQFREFGKALYSAPTGGAVVFSCSLLHEATPVTHGRRYMFLPFLYDDASRLLREVNAQHLSDKVIHLSNDSDREGRGDPAARHAAA